MQHEQKRGPQQLPQRFPRFACRGVTVFHLITVADRKKHDLIAIRNHLKEGIEKNVN